MGNKIKIKLEVSIKESDDPDKNILAREWITFETPEQHGEMCNVEGFVRELLNDALNEYRMFVEPLEDD